MFSLLYSILDIDFWIYFIISNNNTISKRGGEKMPKFIARKPEKEVISLRISTDILKEIDAKASSVDISRNELINQMIIYALQNMEDDTK